MFNPERILGALMKESLGGGFGKKRGHGGFGRGMGMGSKAAIGLGLLGVAMEAIEHFSNQQQASGQGSVTSGSHVPPPPAAGPAAGATPPPPPGASLQASTQAPPPPPGAAPSPEASSYILLIRSMIAAAYADGHLDETERANIMQKLASLSDEERKFLIGELNAPAHIDDIISAVDSPALARQVYAASLLAITADTDAEKAYLKTLASKLFLSDAVVADIHRDMGLGAPA